MENEYGDVMFADKEAHRNSYDVVGEAVKKFWEKAGCRQEVVVFFYQKYEHEDKWLFYSAVVLSCSSEDDKTEFLDDFCEGETCVKIIKVAPLDEVVEYYARNCINDTTAGS